MGKLAVKRGRALATIHRAKIALGYLCPPLVHFVMRLFASKEIANL